LNGTKHRFSGLGQARQCGDDVFLMLVTGGPPVRGGGGMPQRIMTISWSPPAFRDFLGDDNRAVLEGRIALPLDIPILDGADDMTFINHAKHDLDLVTDVAFEVGHQEVDAASRRLYPFTLDNLQVPKPQKRRIVRYLFLQPSLVKPERSESLRGGLLEL
jgi:hypothetical protein